jgi:hypothetical protein
MLWWNILKSFFNAGMCLGVKGCKREVVLNSVGIMGRSGGYRGIIRPGNIPYKDF